MYKRIYDGGGENIKKSGYNLKIKLVFMFLALILLKGCHVYVKQSVEINKYKNIKIERDTLN